MCTASPTAMKSRRPATSRIFLSALAGVLGLAFLSPQASAEPEAGDFEVTLSGSGTSSKGFDSTAFGIAGSFGWFWTDNIEIGVRKSAAIADSEDDTDYAGSIRAFVDYHFDLGKVQPFVGFSLGAEYGDNVNDNFILGPEVGLKYFVKPKTFLFGQAAYQFNVDEDPDDGSFFYTVGMGFNF